MKEIKEEMNRWKGIPCSWVGRINVVKIPTLPKAISRFNVISINIPMVFFTEEKKNPKIYMETQKTLNSTRNPEEKNKVGGITLPDYEQYYKTIVIKMV